MAGLKALQVLHQPPQPMPKKPAPTEKELQAAVQMVGDAMRAHRDSITVRYHAFCVWITEPRKPMEATLKVLRTFRPQEVVRIGDTKLIELYAKAQCLYDATKKEDDQETEKEE